MIVVWFTCADLFNTQTHLLHPQVALQRTGLLKQHSVYQRPLDCTQPGKNMDYLWGIVLLLWALGVLERGTDAQRSKNNIPRLKLSYKGQSPPAVGILGRREIKNQSE